MLQLDFDSPRAKGAWNPKARGRANSFVGKVRRRSNHKWFNFCGQRSDSPGLNPTTWAAVFEEERRAELERQKRREDEVPWSQLMNQSPASKHFILSYLESRWQINKRMDVESWDVLRLQYIIAELLTPRMVVQTPKNRMFPTKRKTKTSLAMLQTESTSAVHFWSHKWVLWISWLTWNSPHHSEARGPICELISFCLVSHPNKPKYHSISVIRVQARFPIS